MLSHGNALYQAYSPAFGWLFLIFFGNFHLPSPSQTQCYIFPVWHFSRLDAQPTFLSILRSLHQDLTAPSTSATKKTPSSASAALMAEPQPCVHLGFLKHFCLQCPTLLQTRHFQTKLMSKVASSHPNILNKTNHSICLPVLLSGPDSSPMLLRTSGHSVRLSSY